MKSLKLKFFITTKSEDTLAQVCYPIATIPQPVICKIGGYVLVRYKGKLWPDHIFKVEKDRMTIKCLQKATISGSVWKWPDKPDDEWYQREVIEHEIETPLDVGSSSSSLRLSNLLVNVL